MSNDLTIIQPGQDRFDQQVGLSKMRDSVKESREFLKVTKGYSEVYMDKMKLNTLGEAVKKASQDITIGQFTKWADQKIESPNGMSYIYRGWRSLLKLLSTPFDWILSPRKRRGY